MHPDKNQQPGAEEAFKILQHAFELIGEPVTILYEHTLLFLLANFLPILLPGVKGVIHWRNNPSDRGTNIGLYV